MKKSLIMALIVLAQQAFAGTVDTISIYSAAMKKTIRCVVIKPDAYSEKSRTFPTVYLLHGHGGRYDNWIKRVPELQQHADKFGMLIVCPDGAVSSWYFDSPEDSTMRYETFIAKEVPAFIESKYRTIKSRARKR